MLYSEYKKGDYMILDIIRHADPDYANNTITEFGKLEAKALADFLKDENIDRIYTSPLGRAIDTAKPLCEIKRMDYVILPWTAESMDYMKRCTKPENCSYRFSILGGVEDYSDLTDEDRKAFLESLVKSSDEFLASLGYVREGARYKAASPNDEHVLVFCHGGFGAAWISHLLMLPPGLGWCNIRLRTTGITRFVFENNPEGFTFPVLHWLSSTSHISLAGLRLNNR
ncbi:MAG: histidine phosphatase family protein [Clostridiales bacterium]|jgi:probable phosphoglycerate mutase|nr:histidine phosphatase family protein [Clostridiales bacterium]